jgi:KDO2-lipid IV(A) lauroyltransferase
MGSMATDSVSSKDAGKNARERKKQGPQINRTRPGPWTERLEFAAALLGVALLWPFSPRWKSRIAGYIGGFLGPKLGFSRRIYQNLSAVRPQYSAFQKRCFARELCANFSRTVVEYLTLPWLAKRASHYKVVGGENLRKAIDQYDGRIVVVSGHIGNWEAVRAVAAAQGAPLAIIYRAFNNALFDKKFHHNIESVGWQAFRKGKLGGRELVRHIKGGAGALILVDQRSGGAPLLNFMGREAETSLAAAQLARTLNAALVPAVAFRRNDNFEVRFEPAVDPTNPAAAMQQINDRIEVWIDEEPGQWFWLHRRWRIRERDRSRRVFGTKPR